MAKDIPEIDDPLQDINDPNLSLDNANKGGKASESRKARENTPEAAKETAANAATDKGNNTADDNSPYSQPTEAVPGTISPTSGREQYWHDFLGLLAPTEEKTDKTGRLVCKLDRDLADTLDDCNINGRCRSDLVNAIVRAFFSTYLPKLLPYRKAKKLLFDNHKSAQA